MLNIFAVYSAKKLASLFLPERHSSSVVHVLAHAYLIGALLLQSVTRTVRHHFLQPKWSRDFKAGKLKLHICKKELFELFTVKLTSE